MILLAESGATKTDWFAVSGDGMHRSCRTVGINPMLMCLEQIREIAAIAVPAVNPEGERIDKVFFYGAGIVSPYTSALIEEALDPWCPFAEMECRSDLEAAARALFGNERGVAAISGTGSNSCLCECGEIIGNIRPGGFILGDEGGAAAVGRMLMADFIKGLVPEPFMSVLERDFALDYESVVRKVYKGDAPSGFLASFAPFVVENSSEPYFRGLLERNFRSFIERSLLRYGCNKVAVVGSFAYACRQMLTDLGKEYGLDFVKFLKEPISELVKYHCHGI